MANPVSPPTPYLPVSWGEVIDKITILEIKNTKLSGADALANVRKELSLLSSAADVYLANNARLSDLKHRLRVVNDALWAVEDDIRQKEAKQEFDNQFIALARSVYKRTDERAAIKSEINALLRSDIVEEKSYTKY
jgi:hypothetical protein